MARGRKLVIHIGLPKTGSTSLQRFFQANLGQLERHGIHVIRSGALDARAGLNSAALRHALRSDFPESGRTERLSTILEELGGGDASSAKAGADLILDNTLDELTRIEKNIRTIVLSSESFSTFKAADLAALKTAFGPHVSSYQIVAYLRRQDQFVVSKYSTDLRHGSTLTLSETLERFQGHLHLRYHKTLNRFADHFGKKAVTPRVFDRGKLYNSDLVHDFMFLMGQKDLSGYDTRIAANASLSAAAQELLRAYNRLRSEAKNTKENKPEDAFIISAIAEKFTGAGQKPTRTQAERFLHQFDRSNEILRKQWFPDMDSVFSKDLSDYPASDRPPEPISSLDLIMAIREKMFEKRYQQRIERALTAMKKEVGGSRPQDRGGADRTPGAKRRL